jgi:hypothetical protein
MKHLNKFVLGSVGSIGSSRLFMFFVPFFGKQNAREI